MYLLPLEGVRGEKPSLREGLGGSLYEICKIFLVIEPTLVKQLVVALANAPSYFLPGDACNLLDAFFSNIVVEALIHAERVDSIRHSVDIPVINLDDIGKDLTAA